MPSPLGRGGFAHRGYHPHVDHPDVVQHVTFRLGDSVPQSLIAQWRSELSRLHGPGDEAMKELQARISRFEDAGYGACWLGRRDVGEIVEVALLHFDRRRYTLLEWCVMPNHVHVMLKTHEGFPLWKTVASWKSYTAKAANRVLGRARGSSFWAPDYFDRFMRDDRQFAATRHYIRQNPVKARLVPSPELWPLSSAARGVEVVPGNDRPPSGTTPER